MQPPSPGLCSALRHRQEPRAGPGGRRPGAAQPEFRQQARRRAAFHPEVLASVPHRDVRAAASERRRVPALPSEPGSPRRARASMQDPDVRMAASRCRRVPAWSLERA
ncbi:hypothetical protein BDS110ZK25_84970 [Bradyrhizobium diazoefficiens]|uniref:Uncharacterized protein n=1 Tax=Bradyrhizobium diazoefficiens TaxID=1355477 RepID=A0A809YU52_9BRAD|nr:hypothetical protein F07S3_05300 [Bradyrhizobium diazoefficiens]BBZ99631.1 hypothetical protein H12S4_05360 [Bradyrhizobium diazoefficiens]BCA08683.1 hypothetical protein BDHF08_05300 [Bradyrhizobium diazoefficiens]BCA17319.1 hypothetical protein BDHH15_05340 [Bradyrhizobium diazoefficiens]BCE17934.1 hypothetical protein XF1B_06150 [Bradyrhizobium diazoefficiens]